ncbi:MAG: hypothetical protein KC668_08205 [Myxococcales bacterium]|nr:hypothetical protein [Myxococcales bacterium]
MGRRPGPPVRAQLRPRLTPPRHYAATLGGMTLELYAGQADVGTRVGFAVSDVDATVSALQALGAPVRVAPKDSPWGRRAVVVDPDGRSVELT